MDWDQRLFGLLDELEQEAEAAFGAERDREVADRARAEYARVALVERLMASIDADLVVDLVGPGVVRGTLRRVGSDWLLLEAPGGDWVVRTDAVVQVRGASARARAQASWSPVQRLGLGSPLRRLADAREPCVLHTTSGSRVEGVLARVGADFAEVRTPAGEALVALCATAAISSPQRAEPA